MARRCSLDKPPAEQAQRVRRRSRKPPKEIPAGASPLTGVVPPAHYRWKPGQSGNPKGRPRAGASIREYINALVASVRTEDELRRVARDQRAPWRRRAAAERVLRMLEHGDIADFQAVLDGTATLAQLRDAGVNTEVVKKLRYSRGVVEIELHDRGGREFDRIMDRTEGKASRAATADDSLIRTLLP
jgi:hypothetical protein